MALLDFFKKKKKEKKEVKTPETSEKKEKTLEAKKVLEKEKKKFAKKRKRVSEVYNIISRPHVSEKSTNLSSANWYTFKISPRANKNEVKEAVEAIYGVDVLAVNIINVPAKKRRLGRFQGFKKGHKKAIVKIKAGQKIEII